MRRCHTFFTRNASPFLVLIAITAGSTHRSHGQDVQGYYTDPATRDRIPEVVPYGRTAGRGNENDPASQKRSTNRNCDRKPVQRRWRSFAPVHRVFAWVPQSRMVAWNRFANRPVGLSNTSRNEMAIDANRSSRTPKTHVHWEPVTSEPSTVPQRLTSMPARSKVGLRSGRPGFPLPPMSSSVAAASKRRAQRATGGIAARLTARFPTTPPIQMGASLPHAAPGIYANREVFESTLQTGFLRATN